MAGGVLTSAGEIEGHYEDFSPGKRIVILFANHDMRDPHSIADGVALGTVAGAHNDDKQLVNGAGVTWKPLWRPESAWKPLLQSVHLWQFYQKSHPNLGAMFTLDCGADGDCLFHSLAAGYNQLFGRFLTSMDDMRAIGARQLASFSNDDLDQFAIDLYGKRPVEYYHWTRREKLWHLAHMVKTPREYWGETGTLRMLFLHAPEFARHHIGFAIVGIRVKPTAFRPITDNERGKYEAQKRKPPKEVASAWEPRPEITIYRTRDTRYLMMLHCLDNWHWVLLGFCPEFEPPSNATVRHLRDDKPGVRKGRIGSTFAIDAFPPPLMPFLIEKS